MTALSAVITRNATGSRPAAGTAGALFYDSTLDKWQRDNGSSWDDCAGATELGYAQITSPVLDSTAGPTVVTGLSLTVTVRGRPIMVEAYLPLVDDTVTTTAGRHTVTMTDSGTVIETGFVPQDASLDSGSCRIAVRVNPGAGSKTYDIRTSNGVPGGTHLRNYAASTAPAWIRVYEV